MSVTSCQLSIVVSSSHQGPVKSSLLVDRQSRRSPQSNPAAGSTAIHRERDTRSSKTLRKSCRRKFQRKQNDVSPYKNNSVAGFLHVRPTEWVEWYDTYRATYAGPVVGQAVPVRPMAAGRQRPANVRSRDLCVCHAIAPQTRACRGVHNDGQCVCVLVLTHCRTRATIEPLLSRRTTVSPPHAPRQAAERCRPTAERR